MDVTKVSEAVISVYQAFAEWCFSHQTEVNVIIGGAVLGSLLYLSRRTLRMRRLTHRIRWGVGMKRSKNRDAFEKGLISFGICDAIEEAVARGDMTRARADQWYISFATDYNMTELLPRKKSKAEENEALKERINKRIMLWEKLKIIIPGASPGVKVDPAYQPNVVALAPAKKKSRYSKAS